MGKSFNQKLKLLYIMQMLKENTDENHAMSANDIISALAKQGISAERKSIDTRKPDVVRKEIKGGRK